MVYYTCPVCGQQFSTDAVYSRVRCPQCNQEFQVQTGQPQGAPTGQPVGGQAGQPYGQPYGAYGQPYGASGQSAYGNIGVFDEGPSGKSRGVAALLAFFLGAIGVHYFYVGKSTPGILFLCVTLLSCGFLGAITGLISLIQGVLLLTQSHDEFEQKWVNPVNSFPLF